MFGRGRLLIYQSNEHIFTAGVEGACNGMMLWGSGPSESAGRGPANGVPAAAGFVAMQAQPHASAALQNCNCACGLGARMAPKHGHHHNHRCCPMQFFSNAEHHIGPMTTECWCTWPDSSLVTSSVVRVRPFGPLKSPV